MRTEGHWHAYARCLRRGHAHKRDLPYVYRTGSAMRGCLCDTRRGASHICMYVCIYVCSCRSCMSSPIVHSGRSCMSSPIAHMKRHPSRQHQKPPQVIRWYVGHDQITTRRPLNIWGEIVSTSCTKLHPVCAYEDVCNSSHCSYGTLPWTMFTARTLTIL